MRYFHFYDEETHEDFYVKASNLWRANETAHYYYTRPFYMEEVNIVTVLTWSWEVYDEI